MHTQNVQRKSSMFSKYQFVKEFKSLGGNEKQGELIADSFRKQEKNIYDNLATKEVVEYARNDLCQQIHNLDEKLTEKINNLDERVTEKINNLDEKFTERINNLDEKFFERMGSLDEKLTARMDSLDEKLTERMNGLDENLTERMSGLDEKLTERMDNLSKEVKAEMVVNKNETLLIMEKGFSSLYRAFLFVMVPQIFALFIVLVKLVW